MSEATDALGAMEMILKQLQSTNNEQRNEAEKAYNAARQQAGPCMVALATLATESADPGVKGLAAVLLRRSAADLAASADAQSKLIVKERLFQGIRAEQNPDSRRKLCDTLSAVVDKMMEINELLGFIIELSKSSTPHHRESALYIFAQRCDVRTLGGDLQPHLPHFFEVFQQGLQDENVSVQVEALRATCAVLNLGVHQQFAELIPLCMRPVSVTLNVQDEDNARLCLELLIDSLGDMPKAWRKFLPGVTDLMLQIANTTQLEEGTRQLGMEFLVTAAEQLPSACRKMGNFVSRVFPAALGFMLEVDDDPSWYERDDDDDDDDQSNYGLGQEAVDRLSIKLGGKTILPVAFAIIPQWLNMADSWTHRHAALLAISQIGEGCEKQISEKLDSVAMMALERFTDPHPRVRWAAVHCIGQMCTDFSPKMQEEFHQRIVPSLIEVMDDQTQPRVQSHAAAATINFCEEARAEIIQLYMDQLLSRLMTLLRSPRKLIQEQAVTAVASVADSAGANFTPYYSSFMPDLKKALVMASGDGKLSKFRGKVMECVSIIGLAVGKEEFQKDSAEVMDVLCKTQSSQHDPDDAHTSYYVMQAFARICRCLKEDFIPYLPYVMPQLLAAASVKPEIEVLGEFDEEADEDDGMDTYVVGDKRIGIRTSALEDKATACSMISCFVSELKGGFIQYVEPVTKLMVPLLRFWYQDDCRIAAAQSLPDLLACVAAQGEAFVPKHQEMFNYIVPELMVSIPVEIDPEVLLTKTDALSEVIGQQPIRDPNLLTSCTECVLEVLKERSERIAERRERAGEDGYDQEEQLEILKGEGTDDELLTQVINVVNSLAKSGGELFINVFEQKLEKIGTSLGEVFFRMLVNQERQPSETRAALYVFDAMIEFCGPGAAKYVDNTLAPMIAYVTDAEPAVKQSAAYGVGISAELFPAAFKRAGGAGVSAPLEAVLRAEDARSADNEEATDNVISAVAKIIEAAPDCLDTPPKFAQALLTYLPLKGDLEEAINVHERLVRMVESGNPLFLGENFSNLGHILRIFAEILETKLLSEQYAHRVVGVLRSMRDQLQGGVLETASQSLSDRNRLKIQQLLMA